MHSLYDVLPKLAHGQVSVLDVAIDRVEPLFPQPYMRRPGRSRGMARKAD